MNDKEEQAKLQPKRNAGEGNESYYKRCVKAGFNSPKIKGACTHDYNEKGDYDKEVGCPHCRRLIEPVMSGFCHPDKDGGE